MSPHWVRMQEIFLAAVELPADERTRYLDAECAGEPALRSEVEAMLARDDPEGASISSLIGDAAFTYMEGTRIIGARLGPWQIIKNISAGGMGLVYLAERADGQYTQRVAIKLIRPGFETGENLVRFHRERQILAQLRHPYIAHLIDGGMTPDGRPFLVMEYVEGAAIDEYIRVNNTSVDQCCRLFTQVCEAVSYAHANGVVHRDLKPSNILVCADGSPRLLDFGIAKLLDAKLDTGLTQTAAGGLLTPDYASPEQVLGQEITPASDVYCLGGILFTMLSGKKPHKIESGDPLEIRRVVCETEVPRPSSLLPKVPDPLAARRAQIQGDLDAITLKALRKEPGKRYQSADELREDVCRHLELRPVTARGDIWTYRAGRFVRRHPNLCIASVLVVIAAAAASFFSASVARKAEARRLYESARAELSRYQETSMPAVLDQLKSSIALDPNYAPAHTAVAEAAIWLAWVPGQPQDEWQAVAKKYATEALALDPKESAAHSVLGDVLFFREWNWQDGARELKEAARLEPKMSSWQVDYVKVLTVFGRYDEALDFLQQAEKVKPGELSFQVQRALLYLYQRNFEKSMEAALVVAKRDPNGVDGIWVLGMAQVQAGQTREGIRVLESGLNRHHRDTRLEAALGNAYGLAGERDKALRMLDLIEHPPNMITPVVCLVCGALIYAGIGDADNTMAWLYRAREAHDGSIPFIPADPRYSRVAGDPRFVELVQWIRKGRGTQDRN